MIPNMVGKLAPNSSHLTRQLVKSVSGRGYFRAVPSQNGDKYVTSPPPQSLNLSALHPIPSCSCCHAPFDKAARQSLVWLVFDCLSQHPRCFLTRCLSIGLIRSSSMNASAKCGHSTVKPGCSERPTSRRCRVCSAPISSRRREVTSRNVHSAPCTAAWRTRSASYDGWYSCPENNRGQKAWQLKVKSQPRAITGQLVRLCLC